MQSKLADYLISEHGFCIPNDSKDYQPDKTWTYKGYKIGTYIPNEGALTVEILCDNVWVAKPMDGETGWKYTNAEARRLGKKLIRQYLHKDYDSE
jgi:hypothetical protein